MEKMIRRCLTIGVGCSTALLALSPVHAAQSPPPISGVTGTIALEGTVDETYKGANTIMVKTADGIRHLFHLTGKTEVHGNVPPGADALRGLESGRRVIVHYAVHDSVRTAVEVDRIDEGGLQSMAGVVTNVDRAARKISIRLADGSVRRLRLTGRAASDVGRQFARGSADRKRVVVYYADDAGEPVAHYFERIP